jgi:hypothetical protein
MRKTLIVIASLLCIAVPAALAAPPAHKDKPGKQEEATTQTAGQPEQNAAQTCKTERSKLGEDAFKAKYGTNANKANAFGKCVSSSSKSKTEGNDEDQNDATESKAEQNAAKKCKAERKQLGEDAFKAKYGTNANKANAFGKCVSKLSKAKSSS